MKPRQHPAKWTLPAVIAALALGMFLARPAAAAGEDCAACHDEVAGAFARTAHGRGFAADARYTGSTCVSCHGDGKAHVDGSGDASKITGFKKLAGRAANEPCLVCHAQSSDHDFWAGGAHDRAEVRCVDCHDVHGHREAAGAGRPSRSPSFAGTESCLKCHTSKRVGLAKRSRHPLREGQMSCVSCHDPHGSSGERLIKADSANDLCMSCHGEKRGPFLWEHSPVREDCLTCHDPHGSNHEGMLVARPIQLCQSCHLQGRHQTIAAGDKAMWNSNRSCLNCHSLIHGSNHPSGPLFQR